MNAFVAWGLSILGLAVVTTIAEMLLPQGKTRRVIKSVAATIAVLVIVTPIPNLLKNGINFDFPQGSVDLDNDYLDSVAGEREKIASKYAKMYLLEKGYPDVFEISVTLDSFEVKTATVNFVYSGMNGNGAHINKSEIVKSVAEYFGIDEEAVMTYG